MTGLEPIGIMILTRAVDFLFDETGKLLERRRASKEMSADDRAQGVESEIVVTQKENVHQWQPVDPLLRDVQQEMEHHLDQLHRYRKNRRILEIQIAQHGGYDYAPTSLQEKLNLVESEILRWSMGLKDLVERVYGRDIVIPILEEEANS